MNILVINAGSSSLKYQLLNPDTQEVLAKGLCERIAWTASSPISPPARRPSRTPTCPCPPTPRPSRPF